jgi:hypothetical protein
MGSTKRARDNRRLPWSGAPDCLVCHRTVSGAPPDSVRCTTELQAKLRTFGNFQRCFTIIHRTVRCYTGQCPMLQGRATLNSAASDFRSAIIHRTCLVHTGLSGEPAEQRLLHANGRLQRIKCAPARAEEQSTRGWHTGQIQDLSGAPPDSQAGPPVRAPTVGTQRPGNVAGAPCDSSLHQTASLVVGVINTPNHPTFKSSKFSTFQPLTRARHSIQDTPK